MSKRGTDNQLTKDDYDREEHNGGSGNGSELMGSFKKASSDEISKRVIKAPRSRLNRMTSGVSDSSDDTKSAAPKFQPFAGMSSSVSALPPAPTAAKGFPSFSFAPQTTASPPAKVVKPDVVAQVAPKPFQFGVPLTTPTVPSPFSSTPFALTPKQPQPPQQPALTTSANTNSTHAVQINFHIGSSGKTADEEYKQLLSSLNVSFLQKLQKEVKRNPSINMGIIFGQYFDHRSAIKQRYKGKLSSDGGSEDATRQGSTPQSLTPKTPATPATSLSTPASQPAKPLFNFGIPSSLAASTSSSVTSQSASTSAFGVFSGGGNNSNNNSSSSSHSSIKAAIDPPKNPFGGFSFTPTAPTATASSLTPSTTGATAGTKPAFTFAPSPLPAFSGFKVPENNSGASSTAGSTPQAEDTEKMPDDTVSNLVDNREGEEGEETVFEVRAKLYGFENKEHKDMGVGQLKINKSKTETKDAPRRRMIMRTTGIGSLLLNSWVIAGMPPKQEKAIVTFFAIEDGKPKRYMVRVKTEDSAKELCEAMLGA